MPTHTLPPLPPLPNPFLLAFSDPLFLVTLSVPIMIFGGLIIYRIRVSRRVNAIAKRNEQVHKRNEEQWQEAAARSQKMVELLTEIRDHLAKWTPKSNE